MIYSVPTGCKEQNTYVPAYFKKSASLTPIANSSGVIPIRAISSSSGTSVSSNSSLAGLSVSVSAACSLATKFRELETNRDAWGRETGEKEQAGESNMYENASDWGNFIFVGV